MPVDQYTSPEQIVNDLKATGSSLEKRRILYDVLANYHNSNVCKRFVDGARLVYSPFVTFGIKQLPTTSDITSSAYNIDAWFHVIAEKLENRELTGNAAANEVQTLADSCNSDLWNGFYRKVLNKNLDCGVNITTYNKVADVTDSTLKVYKFGCQLASTRELHKLPMSDYFVQPKLDGIRCLAFVHTDGAVKLYSRNGKKLVNFPRVESQLSEIGLNHLDRNSVFDGEIMSSSFNDLMKQVHRKDNVKTDDAIFHIFDYIPEDEFLEDRCLLEQTERTDIVLRLIKEFDNLEPLPAYTVCQNSDFTVQANLDKLEELNRSIVEAGYEGIVLKDGRGVYTSKRSNFWVKVKPTIEVTLQVKDVVVGTGKYSSTTGALTCEGTDTGKFISVSVGSGLSDEMRNQIWSDKESVIGQMVEITADAISQNQDGSYSLRFPRFKTFRGFDAGEKM